MVALGPQPQPRQRNGVGARSAQAGGLADAMRAGSVHGLDGHLTPPTGRPELLQDHIVLGHLEPSLTGADHATAASQVNHGTPDGRGFLPSRGRNEQPLTLKGLIITVQSVFSLSCLIHSRKRKCYPAKAFVPVFCSHPDEEGAGLREHVSTDRVCLENIMEVFELLLASKYGFAALASVALAITMLASTLGTLAYKAKRSDASTA